MPRVLQEPAGNGGQVRITAMRSLLIVLAAIAAIAGCSGEERPTPAERRSSRSLDRDLIVAAGEGDPGRVRRMLARGADVRARDAAGATALVRAAYGNHVDVARLLAGAGAEVNVKDETTQSAYLIATSEVGDDPRLLDVALGAGARIDDKDSFDGTGLIRAAERGHVRIVRRLLRAGIDRDHVNRLGWTALLEAIVLGDGGPRHVATVRALVRGGADVDLADRDGVRPLAHAEQRGYREIARVLRAAGARR
jgi:uncharacterized protein